MTTDRAKQIIEELDLIGWTFTEALNHFNEEGLISDHCIELREVCEADAVSCLRFLKGVKK